MRQLLLFGLALVLSSCSNPANNPGKVIRWSVPDDVKTLDPALATDRIAYTVLTQNYETLYQYSYGSAQNSLEPLLAESLPEVSKDGLTYTIRLKRGIRFQDDPAFLGGKGRELNASDVVYSWKRLFLPELAASRRSIFEDVIEGMADFKTRVASASAEDRLKVFDTTITGLRALDERTLQIKLRRKYPVFILQLAQLPTSVVAREVVEHYGFENLSNHAVGTGPFLISSYTRGSDLVLKRNPGYRDKIETDEIHIRIIRQAQTGWLHFLNGDLDEYGVPKDEEDNALHAGELSPELKAKGISLHKAQDVAVTCITINMKHPVLGSNLNLRKAISRAIDRKKWISVLRGGRAIEATGYIPPGIDGYRRRKELPLSYNIEEAKRLLAKAGFPGGKGLPVFQYDIAGGDTASRQAGEFVAQSLKAIGIQIRVNISNNAAYMTKLNDGSLEIFVGTSITVYADAEAFLKFAYGKFAAPGPNAANWVNGAYDRLFEKIITMEPSPARAKLITQSEDILLENAAIIPLFHPVIYSLQQKRLKNYHPESRMAANFLKYLKIENAE